MRIDKFLKVTRIIKRRTIANEAASSGRIVVNDKVVKPSYDVKPGDIVEIKFANSITKFKVLSIPVNTQSAKNLEDIISFDI